MGLAVFNFTRKKRPRFDQKLPTGTSEQSSGGRLAKMWTRIVSIEPTCASRVLNDLGTTLFPLKLSFGEIDTKLELNPHTTKINFIGDNFGFAVKKVVVVALKLPQITILLLKNTFFNSKSEIFTSKLAEKPYIIRSSKAIPLTFVVKKWHFFTTNVAGLLLPFPYLGNFQFFSLLNLN